MISEDRKHFLEETIIIKLEKYENFSEFYHELKAKYGESHRYYHTWDHVLDLIDQVMDQYHHYFDNDLLLSILFHDAIYNPRDKDNEEKSAEYFKKYFPDNNLVYNAIINTKNHKMNDNFSQTSYILNQIDMSILYQSNMKTFIDYENKIMKEYQFIDYESYRKHRLDFLKSVNGIKEEFINYVKYYKPNIAIYCGSFNPFHKGHMNILEKAEKIFDKVIICKGINPDKGPSMGGLPAILGSHQLMVYDGLLTDFIDTFNYEVTLVRGLRNSADFEAEKVQYRYLCDLKPDIKVVNIISDAEFEHISSSSIRTLKKYNKGENYLV